MSNDPRIRLAIENWDAYVAQLATLSDKKRVQKLEVINMQEVIAQEKNITSSSELLEIWWRQVVEERQDALNEFTQPVQQSRPKIRQQQDNDNQLSLF